MFTPVASTVAASLASPGMQGRALSLRTMGSTASFLIGVPLGTVIGGHYGWQTSFLLVATLAGVTALGAKVMLPDVARDVGSPGGGTFLSHLAIVRRGAIFAVLSLSLLTLMVCFVVLTYVRPILENPTGFGTEGSA